MFCMKIGVMDSGIGGITTLARLMTVCGGEYLYVRDARSPYGDKSDEFVLRRTLCACKELRNSGAEIIVLACNTATNVAIDALRNLDKRFVYIGVEPAVRPALKSCKKVAVALTPAAARQKKFAKLIGGSGDRIKIITIPQLASEIERRLYCEADMMKLAQILYAHCDDCDGLVLGCTHYIFLKKYISAIDPSLRLFDGNDGVARRLFGFTGYMGDVSVRFLQIK